MASTATTPVPDSAAAELPAQQMRWTPRLWGTLLVLCGALFLDGLDVSMVGVALPSIQADLGLSNSTLQWVVSGYVLGYGGLLLLGGRTADLLGRRRVFLWSIAIFAVASLLGGLVNDPALLVGTRFVKGVAAAFTAPAGLSIITTTFHEGPARNRALSFFTACGASGFSMGLIFGGLMTEVGWRWTFLLPVPIALAVLVAGIRLIPSDVQENIQKRGMTSPARRRSPARCSCSCTPSWKRRRPAGSRPARSARMRWSWRYWPRSWRSNGGSPTRLCDWASCATAGWSAPTSPR
ncbi:MFS transporter [Phytohabitans flavus]|uniref:MFS transporter n=1 Tax=Phytohabitans flavus TaxID=1076124 RepID=UPI0036281C1B